MIQDLTSSPRPTHWSIYANQHAKQACKEFIQYLITIYQQTKFPTYFKEPDITYTARQFIMLALVHKEIGHHLTHKEREKGTMLKLRGNIDCLAKDKSELDMASVGMHIVSQFGDFFTKQMYAIIFIILIHV